MIASLSHDLANLTDDTIEYQEKGVSFQDAIASVENVCRTALVSIGHQLAGPAGALLANLLADKLILQQSMKAENVLRSIEVGVTAGYIADHIDQHVDSPNIPNIQNIQKMKRILSNVTHNSVRNTPSLLINEKFDHTYTLVDFLSTLLKMAEKDAMSKAFPIGINNDRTEKLFDKYKNLDLLSFTKIMDGYHQALKELVTNLQISQVIKEERD